MRNIWRQRHQLAILTSVVLLIVLGVITYSILDSVRSTIRQNIHKQQFAMVTTLAHEIDENIQGHIRLMEMIAGTIPPGAFSNATDAREEIRRHRETAIVFDGGLLLYAADGHRLAGYTSSGPIMGPEVFPPDRLREAARGLPLVFHPSPSLPNASPAVLFAVPARDREGRLLGIVAGAIGLFRDNFLGNIADAHIGQKGYLYLFNKDRTLIIHPTRSRVLKNDVPLNSNKLFDRAISGFEGSGETVSSKGEQLVSSFRHLKSVPWILAVNFPTSEAYASLGRTMRLLLIAFACILTGGGCIVLFTIGRLGKEATMRQQAEDNAQHILDSVDDGVLGTDSAEEITFANRAALRLLGFDTADELLGMDLHQLTHHTKSDGSPYPKEECPISKAIQEGVSTSHENDLLWRRDGSSFAADLSCTPIHRDGDTRGGVMVFRDLSARKDAEARLRLQGAALEAADNGIVITNHMGKILWINQAFSRLTGYSRDEAIGLFPRVLKSGCHDDRYYQTLWQTILDGKSWHGELINRRKDGTLYTEDATITPVQDDKGAITHFIGIKRDISDRKQAESALLQSKHSLEESNHQLVMAMERATKLAAQAERANQAKSEFLANMSHEIRTPMNAVVGISHLLLETDPSPQQRELLLTIRKSADSLLRIITNVLDFSKIEAGEIGLELVEFSPVEVMQDIMALFAFGAEHNNLELAIDIDRITPGRLLGDSLRLSQILNNLMSNALKFTHQGRITLSVRTVVTTRDSVELLFSVQDTGIGMSEKDQEHLFQAFKQVDGSVTRRYGGTGLGLAICRQLATLMGGRIWCESQPGRGSLFSCQLPFAIPAMRTATQPAQTPDDRSWNFGGQRILLVEDNPLNQLVASTMLSAVGLQVTVASNGAEALDRINAQDFDLVLMDIQMPVMDGLTAAGKIRRMNKPGCDGIPILAVSAHATREDIKASHAAGMNAHITKPFMPENLYSAIAGLLAERSDNAKRTAITPSLSVPSPKPAPGAVTSGAPAPHDSVTLLSLVGQLETSLQDYNPTACRELVETLYRKEWPAQNAAELRSLCRLVGEYNYDEALVALSGIKNLLAIQREE